MSDAAADMAPEHLPAWRKLGLKLKSEEASTPRKPVVLPTIESTPATKKRKLSLPDSLRDHVAAANRDQSPDVVSTPHPLAGANGGGSERRHALRRSVSMEDQTSQTSPRKRKSVSFTPDTKVEDGGKSLQELHFATAQDVPSIFDAYIAESISSQVIEPTVEENNAGVEKKAAKKKKKKSKSHSTLISASSSTSDPHLNEDEGTSKAKTSNLRYLEEYLQEPANWKFNKNKEVWTVKHALDVEKIPAKYDAALFIYVRGLKNKMLRLRLFQNAKEVLADDDGELTDEQKANLEKAAQLADDRAQKATEAGRYHVGMKNPGDPDIPIDTAAYQHEAIVQALKSIRKRVHDEALADEEKARRETKEFKIKMLQRARAQQLMWAVGPEKWFSTTAVEDMRNPPKLPPRSVNLKPGGPTTITIEDGPPDAEGTRARRRKRRRHTGDTDDDTSSAESDLASDSEVATKLATTLVRARGGDTLPDFDEAFQRPNVAPPPGQTAPDDQPRAQRLRTNRSSSAQDSKTLLNWQKSLDDDEETSSSEGDSESEESSTGDESSSSGEEESSEEDEDSE